MAQPTTRRLYRSIQTARYRQPAVVRMVVMSPAQQRLGAAGLNSCSSRFSATPLARLPAFRQSLNPRLVYSSGEGFAYGLER
jgi:hypothetical protein